MDLSQLAEEEKKFLARLSDLESAAGRSDTARFTAFCNEREVLIAGEYIRQSSAGRCLLYGGYPGATRRITGFFGLYREPDPAAFPIEGITLQFPKGHALTHRDVLGSLMALKLTRESIGDIVLEGDRCYVFLLASVAPVVCGELRKIGRTGIRLQPGVPQPFEPQARFEQLRGTVSSMRFDCIVALLTGLSREKSARMIRSRLVQLNHLVIEDISHQLAPGDMLSLRGYGKYTVDVIGAPTKKGRLPVACRKYA